MHTVNELTVALRDAMASRWNELRDRAGREEQILRELGAALGEDLPALPAMTEAESQRADAIALHGPAQTVARALCLLTVDSWKPINGPPGPLTIELSREALERVWCVRALADGALKAAEGFDACFEALTRRAGLRGEVSAEALLLAAIGRALSCAEADGLDFNHSVDDGAFGTVRSVRVVVRAGEARYRIGDGGPRTNPTGLPLEGALVPHDRRQRGIAPELTLSPPDAAGGPAEAAGAASPRRRA